MSEYTAWTRNALCWRPEAWKISSPGRVDSMTHLHDSGAGNENCPLIQHDCQGSLRAPWCPSLDQAPAGRLAYLACQSLIAEAELTPKPGLVDRRSAGAHTDLSLSIMKLSAFAIEPYVCEMAFVSGGSHPSQALR